VVENGEAQIIVQSAITVNSQFDVFISSNEDNSNFIFAPDEPNPTPNLTCTPTQTPGLPTATPTPSVTPTITPTPSSTPSNVNPSTLGALWWNQYSNPSFLNLSGVNILSVIDGINATTLFQTAPSPNQVQFQSGIYPSIAINASGGTGNINSSKMSSLNGEYSGTSDFTIFSRYYYSGSSGESAITSSDSGGGSPNGELYDGSFVPYRWYQNKIFGGNIEFNVWADPNTANGFVNVNIPLTGNTWVNQAVRAYQDGADYKIEVWVNNVLINSNQITFTSVPPVLNPGIIVASAFIGSVAEQFQFNKKLTTLEMANMFAYLNNKY
jgi:hypothetical protein